MKNIKVKKINNDSVGLTINDVGDRIDLSVDSIKKTSYPIDVELTDVDISKYTDEELKDTNTFINNIMNICDFNIDSGEYHYEKGEVLLIGLGIAMELPEGYEAELTPRSSTFKKTGFLLTNSVGVIDNSYCGDEDEWMVMVYCTRKGSIKRHDTLFQFRLLKNQPSITIKEVESLDNESRGGFGTTDKEVR